MRTVPLRQAPVRTVLSAVALAFAVLLPPGPTTQAAAPPPPYDPCLAQGSFNIADPACLTWHPPVSGDWFGPIGDIVQHVAKRGDSLSLSFAPGVEVFFDRAISCGIGGCIGHSIRWRPDEGQLRGFWMQPQEGCGGADLSCSFRVWPDWDLGDAGERWNVLYVQHYRGIFPQKGLAHAIYVAPRYYPVRLDPVDTAGRPTDARPGTAAYAVRSGRPATAGACVAGAWWAANRRVVDPPVPDCVRLDRIVDAAGRSGYEGVLPVDSGDWTIVAAPAGAASASLASRPSPFRGTSVRPVGDDIRIPIVKERRPVPAVTITPTTDTVMIGGIQDVTVTVAAVDGEVGSITLAFTDPAMLTTRPTDRPRVGIVPGETEPAGGFTLATGEERTFTVQVAGLEPGEASLAAAVTGVNDVGESVEADAASAVAVVAAGSASALEPPVVDTAVAATEGGALAGTALGTPDSTLSIGLWSSVAGTGGACSQRLSGPGVVFLGTVDVAIGQDGTGPFTFVAPLTEGWLAYGVSSDGARVSRVGECRLVDGALPTISIAGARIAEGTGDGEPTRLGLTVTLSRPIATAVTVRASTRDGSAVSPADHEALTDTEVRFEPGETTATLTVDVVPDADQEEDETFDVVLSDPVGGRLPEPGAALQAEATVTIVDDDADAVREAPDVRGVWRWVYRTKHLGKRLTATYTITITDQDPSTGAVKGRIKGDVYAPYPDFTGRVVGTVSGDRVDWKVSGAGKAYNGPIRGTLVRRNGTLGIRIEGVNGAAAELRYLLVEPRDGR